jgi:hypothetical protein
MMSKGGRLFDALLLAALLCPALPAAAAAGQGRWSPDAPSNRELLPTFNYSMVEGVLDEIGARHERRGPATRPSLLVTFQSGRRAAIVFGSCSDGGNACRAISLQAGWTLPRGANSRRAAELTQAFARRYAFSRAFVLANGNLALQRYLTADYGFIRGNLAVNLLAFAAQLDLFAREVLGPLSRR